MSFGFSARTIFYECMSLMINYLADFDNKIFNTDLLDITPLKIEALEF